MMGKTRRPVRHTLLRLGSLASDRARPLGRKRTVVSVNSVVLGVANLFRGVLGETIDLVIASESHAASIRDFPTAEATESTPSIPAVSA
jgi:hypothetical protein